MALWRKLPITDAEIAELKRLIEKMEHLDEHNYADFLVLDIEFHEMVIQAARNPIFQSLYLTSIRRLGRVSRIYNEPCSSFRRSITESPV